MDNPKASENGGTKEPTSIQHHESTDSKQDEYVEPEEHKPAVDIKYEVVVVVVVVDVVDVVYVALSAHRCCCFHCCCCCCDVVGLIIV